MKRISEISDSIRNERDERRRCEKLMQELRDSYRKYPQRKGKIFNIIYKENKIPAIFYRDLSKGDNAICVDRYVVIRSANICAQEALTSDTAFQVVCDWLQSDYTCAPMLSAISRIKVHGLVERLLREKRKIVCQLLRQESGIHTSTLGLLEKVAEHSSQGIQEQSQICQMISDVLEDCLHSMRWKEKARRTLAIASIVNPVDPLGETIQLDTAYLINWGLAHHYFKSLRSAHIRDLIGHLCTLVTEKSSSDLERLRKLLKLNRTIDLLMFLPQGIKRYRSHDIHQFNVAMLGLFFLETMVKDNLSLAEYLATNHQDQFLRTEDVKRAWLLAALLHDHALPISHMFRIAPHVSDIAQDDDLPQDYKNGVNMVQNALNLAYKDLFASQLYEVYQKFVEKTAEKSASLEELTRREMSRIESLPVTENGLGCFDPYDHGILAAVNLTSRFRNKRLDTTVQVAAKAIGRHSLKDGNKISFKAEPLTFLLKLCDELQEWGREIAVFPEILMDISSVTLRRFRIDGVNRVFGRCLGVSFRVLSNEGRTKFDTNIFDLGKYEFLNGGLEFDDPAFPMICHPHLKVTSRPSK